MDIRSRAIMFARSMPLNEDVIAGITKLLEPPDSREDRVILQDNKAIRDEAWSQLRIGIDNMVAHSFEVGYEAKIEEPHRKGRSLIDRLRGRKRLTDD
jgi:hypothetical protein